jgi:hypothetical protein
MVPDDHESVFAATNARVLVERQLDPPHTCVVHAFAEERNELDVVHRLDKFPQAFVPHPEGTLIFCETLLPGVQSKLGYPWPVTLKRGPDDGNGFGAPEEGRIVGTAN